MMDNLKVSEKVALVGAVDPQVVVGDEVFTDYIDMAAVEQVLGMLLLGTMADKKLNFRVVGYSDSAGNDAVEIQKIVEIAHANAYSGKQITLEVRRDQVAQAGTEASKVLRFVRFGVKSEAAQDGSLAIAAAAMGFRYGLAPANSLDSVTIS